MDPTTGRGTMMLQFFFIHNYLIDVLFWEKIINVLLKMRIK